MATILVNHVFIQDGTYPELTCVRCHKPYSAMRQIHFQLDPTERPIEILRQRFEWACAGPGSAEFARTAIDLGMVDDDGREEFRPESREKAE